MNKEKIYNIAKKYNVEVNENLVDFFVNSINQNNGYCPCRVDKTPDTKCPCKDLRENSKCVCGLFKERGDKQ